MIKIKDKQASHADKLLRAFVKVKPVKALEEVARAAYSTLKQNASHEDPQYNIKRLTDSQKSVFLQYAGLYSVNGKVVGILELLEESSGLINYGFPQQRLEQPRTALPSGLLFKNERLTNDGKKVINDLSDAVKNISQYEADAIMACLGVSLNTKNLLKRSCEVYLRGKKGYEPGVYTPLKK